MDINSILGGIDVNKYSDLIVSGTLSYAPKLIWALLTLWIWFKVIKFIVNLIDKAMSKSKIDVSLKGFIISLVKWTLKVLLILTAVGMLWVQTTSFVAILAAAWLAIGMSLSGTLQNFAGGVMLLLFKPFDIGDFVEVSGYAGTIQNIHIFNTYILTGDKKTIIIPNGDISGSSMINYSISPKRRVDLVIGIGYDDDIDLAKATLEEIAKANKKVLVKDGITIWVSELWDNAVNIVFRFFVKNEDYWSVYFETLETVKKTFDKKSIGFPYPQRDVHMYNMK